MISEGIDGLEIERVFKDISQLADFSFLRRLSIRGLKRGIDTLKKLVELSDLSLWQLTDLDTEWLGKMPQLQRLFCHTISFKSFHLPQPPCSLESLELNLFKGLGGHLNISGLTNLQSIKLEACGNVAFISDCSQLVRLRTVVISNIRDFESLAGVAAAPNLEAIIVQDTPKLTVDDIIWMLDHPTLKEVYPALKTESEAPILKEISLVLAPRFGENLFE